MIVYLLEVNSQGYHLGVGVIDGVGVLHQRPVDEVGAFLFQDVEESEGKLQFGYQLEERQIDVAAQAYLEEAVEGFSGDGTVLVVREVYGRRSTRYKVGTEVVVSRSCHLHGDGYGDIGRLQHLCGVPARVLLVKPDALLSEIHRRGGAQGKVVGQTQFAQYADGESGIVAVDVGIPLFTRSRVDESVVFQFHVLHLEAEEESPVQASHIQIGSVLYLALLSGGGAN